MFCRRLQPHLGAWVHKSSRSLTQPQKLPPMIPNFRVCSMSQSVDRLRFMQKVKEDEATCRKSISEGYFMVFCNMKPLLSTEGIMWKSYTDVMQGLTSFNVDPSRDAVFVTLDELESPPKFAVNVSSDKSIHLKEFEAKISGIFGGRPCSLRKAMFVLPQDTAAILSTAHSMLQWHSKTQYCSCCGQTTAKDASGFKRTCTSCSETFYPSIQPIAITLVTNGDRCVLARQPRFPPLMYSALAGFCEPGESLAMTVQREVAEEVGLEIGQIRYHDSQSWPLPRSGLMLGCYAQLKNGSSDEIKIDKTEIEEAKWVERGELRTMLKSEGASNMPGLVGGPDFYIPPPQAIANQLIAAWTFEKIK